MARFPIFKPTGTAAIGGIVGGASGAVAAEKGKKAKGALKGAITGAALSAVGTLGLNALTRYNESMARARSVAGGAWDGSFHGDGKGASVMNPITVRALVDEFEKMAQGEPHPIVSGFLNTLRSLPKGYSEYYNHINNHLTNPTFTQHAGPAAVKSLYTLAARGKQAVHSALDAGAKLLPGQSLQDTSNRLFKSGSAKKIAAFDWEAARKSAIADSFPAVGSVLGAGIASGMSNEHRKINPLSGAAIGYGVGGLAEMAYHHLKHQKHASVEKTSGKKIRTAVGALGAAAGAFGGLHVPGTFRYPAAASVLMAKRMGGSHEAINRAARGGGVAGAASAVGLGAYAGSKGALKVHDLIEKKLQDRKAAKESTPVQEKTAFSLAEFGLTVGIVGTGAALAMPPLMRHRVRTNPEFAAKRPDLAAKVKAIDEEKARKKSLKNAGQTKVSYVDSALSVFNKVSALSMSSGQTGWGQMASSAGNAVADAAKAKARNLAAAAARNQSLAGQGATAFQHAAQALPVVKGRLLS